VCVLVRACLCYIISLTRLIEIVISKLLKHHTVTKIRRVLTNLFTNHDCCHADRRDQTLTDEGPDSTTNSYSINYRVGLQFPIIIDHKLNWINYLNRFAKNNWNPPVLFSLLAMLPLEGTQTDIQRPTNKQTDRQRHWYTFEFINKPRTAHKVRFPARKNLSVHLQYIIISTFDLVLQFTRHLHSVTQAYIEAYLSIPIPNSLSVSLFVFPAH